MSATKILDAFATLAAAIPGSPRSATFNLHGCNETTLVWFRSLPGAEIEHYQNEVQTEEWECVTVRRAGILVSAFGPHHPVTPIDEVELECALEAVEEVVRP